jgi:hypothetical protein
MENLWIEIINGQTVNHPYLESNLLQACPEWNGVVPLDRFAPFIRREPPPDKIVISVEYQLVDGVWTDVFECTDIPTEEYQLVDGVWTDVFECTDIPTEEPQPE